MIILFYTGICLFLGLCFLLSFVVLIQESKSLGLGASFGGDAGSSVFGTSTADVLKKFTAWLAVLFFAMCFLFSCVGGVMNGKKGPTSPMIEEIQ